MSWKHAAIRAQKLLQTKPNDIVLATRLPFELFDYQIVGAKFLIEKKYCILADDMGLGKTFQVIASLVTLHLKTLIICPKSVIHQWQELVNKSQLQAIVKIINYEQIYAKSKTFTESFMYDIIVLDEAQRIKNITTKISQMILHLPQTKYRWILTGTPIENRIEELFPLLFFINEFDIFEERSKKLDYGKINSILTKRMLRRLRDESIEVEYINHSIPMNDAFLQIYQSMVDELRENIDIDNPLAILTRIRRLCTSPMLTIHKNELQDYKLAYITKLLSELVGVQHQQGIIVTESRILAKLLQKQLLNISSKVIAGDTTAIQRKNIQQEFIDNKFAILIMTRAGELGLNLQCASFIIHYDMPYNPARIDQREGRILRLGQKNTVKVYIPFYKDSYEEKIFNIVANKRLLFNELINGQSKEKVAVKKDFIKYLFDLE